MIWKTLNLVSFRLKYLIQSLLLQVSSAKLVDSKCMQMEYPESRAEPPNPDDPQAAVDEAETSSSLDSSSSVLLTILRKTQSLLGE